MITQLPGAGTVVMDVANIENRTEGAQIYALTPTANVTINANPDGLANQEYAVIVTTNGTTSYNVTFGANFQSTGTVASGTVSGKVFVIKFISKGVNLIEVSRTTAI